MTTLYCALCLYLLDQRPVAGQLVPDSSVAATVVHGHAACTRHFAYLQFARPLGDSAAVARTDGALPSWGASPTGK